MHMSLKSYKRCKIYLLLKVKSLRNLRLPCKTLDLGHLLHVAFEKGKELMSRASRLGIKLNQKQVLNGYLNGKNAPLNDDNFSS